MTFTKEGPKRRRSTRRHTKPERKQGWVGHGPKWERAKQERQALRNQE